MESLIDDNEAVGPPEIIEVNDFTELITKLLERCPGGIDVFATDVDQTIVNSVNTILFHRGVGSNEVDPDAAAAIRELKKVNEKMVLLPITNRPWEVQHMGVLRGGTPENDLNTLTGKIGGEIFAAKNPAHTAIYKKIPSKTDEEYPVAAIDVYFWLQHHFKSSDLKRMRNFVWVGNNEGDMEFGKKLHALLREKGFSGDFLIFRVPNTYADRE